MVSSSSSCLPGEMALDTARIAAETGRLLAYQADTGSRIGTTRRQVAYEG